MNKIDLIDMGACQGICSFQEISEAVKRVAIGKGKIQDQVELKED